MNDDDSIFDNLSDIELPTYNIDTVVPTYNNLSYSVVHQRSKPPYHCSCTDKPFLTRQFFQRHMNKHGIMIPYKAMNKRKVDEINPDDGIVVVKEFKRYYTNLFFILIDYLTKLKLG